MLEKSEDPAQPILTRSVAESIFSYSGLYVQRPLR